MGSEMCIRDRVGAVEAEQGDAEVVAVLLQLGDLRRGHGVDDGQVQRCGGDAVVHRGHGLLLSLIHI